MNSPDGVTTNTWDTAPLGKGRLQRSVSPDGVALSYTYNDRGQTTSEKWVMENVTYQVNLDYDGIGRLGSVTYPKMPGPEPRFKVNYGYKPNGYLAHVTDASTSALYWRVDDRNAAGQLTKQTYGNLASEDRTYRTDIGTLETITTFAPGGQQLARVSHEFDQNGNLAVVEEDMVIGAVRHEFRHDRLNRLTEWQFWTYDGGEDWDQDFAKRYDYNKNGNLDSETGGRPGSDATYQYGQLGAPPHALTTRNGQTYTYDAAGRQITAPGRTVAYTAFNLPRRITWGNNQATNFTYDSAGRRVLKRDGALTTVTVAGLFERRVASAEVQNIHYVLADGRAVAQVTKVQAVSDGPVTQPAQVVYLHDDVLGNVIRTTNPSGQVRDTFGYDPFGRRIDRLGIYLPPQRRPVRRGYTGHEHDDELDLINMRGRIFDPVARRFLTPDPFIPNPLGSQSYNRYSYVENNPTTFIDPTGFEKCGDLEGCVGKGSGSASAGGGVVSEDGWLWGVWPVLQWPSGYREPVGGYPGSGSSADFPPPMWDKGCTLVGGCPGSGNADDNPGTDAGGSSPTGGGDYGSGGGPGGPVNDPSSGVCTTIEGCEWQASPVEVPFESPFGQGFSEGLDALFHPWRAIEGFRQDPLGWDAFVARWEGIFEANEAAANGDWGPYQRMAGQATPGAILSALTGFGLKTPNLLKAGRFMDHHVFPQQFRKFFQGKGIDIDQFTVPIEETMHLKGVHGRGLGNMPGRWNARWSEFIDANPGATAKDVYQFAGRLMDEFGLSGLPIRPYPR